MLIARVGGTGNRGFHMSLNAGGGINLSWNWEQANDANSDGLICTNAELALPSDGSAIWIRGTIQPDNGAGGRATTIYKSTDKINWTRVNQLVKTGTKGIAVPTANVLYEIGGRSGSVNSSQARVTIPSSRTVSAANGWISSASTAGAASSALLRPWAARTSATRLKKMVPKAPGALHFLSTRYNELTDNNGYAGVLNTGAALFEAINPGAGFAYLIQNPQMLPLNSFGRQSARQRVG